MRKSILIRGARVHNLKNITLNLPRNAFIVVTGVSGSGKSSLAFDTLYAEGQRRYVESLSAYARQFLERMDKPDVDEISGISPAIAVEQKNTVRTSRSTVGTVTEIYDYLRLLFARVGKTICPTCNIEVKRYTRDDIFQFLMARHPGKIAFIGFKFSPREGQPSSSYKKWLIKNGFHRILINGKRLRIEEIDEFPPESSQWDVLVDRLQIQTKVESRWMESLELALEFGNRAVSIWVEGESNYLFAGELKCPHCGRIFPEPQPRLFSFNNPYGACPTCHGFGDVIGIDFNRVVPNPRKTLRQGAVEPWNTKSNAYMLEWLKEVAPEYGIPLDVPFEELTAEQKRIVFEGKGLFPGVRGFFTELENKKYKIGVRVFLSRYRGYSRCPDCGGTRLRPEALNVFIGGKRISDIAEMTIAEALDFLRDVKLSRQDEAIAGQIKTEIENRLVYLIEVGLDYLTLNRRSSTLSGGEMERIHLATALGSKLSGTLYILDEPTVGLHPRDTRRLISVLKEIRNLGNTVVVVEHDPQVMREADFIVDIGPGAGKSGGEILYAGSFSGLLHHPISLTGQYLRGDLNIPVPKNRRKGSGEFLVVKKAREHNLKSIDVRFPLGLFCVVTGVSGSGKSTLVYDVLFAGIKRLRGTWRGQVGLHEAITGWENLNNEILVDQSPIGRTPRSNPATYLKAFDGIRQIFAETRLSKIRGYKPGRFSFNVKGGRCDVCEGAGVIKVEMQFLSDVYLTCEACGGKRYKREILEVTYKGKTIADVLEMTVEEAIAFFNDFPKVKRPLQLLADVGLGYLKLGQPATTLSGGEAQRIKLAAHLSMKSGQHILYIFDEPTTGLHPADIAKLLKSFDRLIEAGNSVIVIEHNLDVIKCADYVIDLGPEGGEKGGRIVAKGTPEEIASCPKSYTGQFLKSYLSPRKSSNKISA